MANTISRTLRPVHPFPARMASSIALQSLPQNGHKVRVLDCMAGSGTTLAAARILGHTAIGFDTDPLAVLIARTWCTDIDKVNVENKAQKVFDRAQKLYSQFSATSAYPAGADEETRAFIRFWFDYTNRRQLTALSYVISEMRESDLKSILWCALSKMIITKRRGVSLAMDVSHSRPHRVYSKAPVNAFFQFIPAVKSILRASPFEKGIKSLPSVKVCKGDARRLPLQAESVDLVITSPPYLNAINYLRGHKLALVWMGYTVRQLRDIRARNVGTEISATNHQKENFIDATLRQMGKIDHLPSRHRGMISQYIIDMNSVLNEIHRVLTKKGRAVIVVGDSTIRETFIMNSKAIQYLGTRQGLKLISIKRRKLPENRRYLPPPSTIGSGKELQRRMREEIIITFQKPASRKPEIVSSN